MFCTPFPGRLEGSDPDTDLRRLRFGLLRCVCALAVARPVHRMAVLDHPRRDAGAIGALAIPDKTAIPIPGNESAFDRTGDLEERLQSRGRAAPAGIIDALGVIAVLLALWRVDAIKTDPLTVDLDRIAIDDRCDTADRPLFGIDLGRNCNSCNPVGMVHCLRDKGGSRTHCQDGQQQRYAGTPSTV